MYPLIGVLENSEKLVCSERCHCPINPAYFDGDPDVEVVDVNNGQKCSSSSKCVFYDIGSEGLNVEKCLEINTPDSFYGTDMDFEMELMEMLEKLEEKKQCSGGISNPDEKLHLYLFSNVNNGVPKYSCHEFVVEQIKDNMNAFRAGLILMLVVEFGYIGGFLVVLLIKCKNRFSKKDGDQQQEQKGPGGVVQQQQEMGGQDHNGIHVELADYDEADESGKKDAEAKQY